MLRCKDCGNTKRFLVTNVVGFFKDGIHKQEDYPDLHNDKYHCEDCGSQDIDIKLEKEKEKVSPIEEATKKFIRDVVKDVNEEMLNKENDLDCYTLGLEVLSHIYKILLNGDFDAMCIAEYTYRNGNLYSLAEELNS